jgi:predicted phosphodiesterase
MMRKRFLFFALWLMVAGAILAPQQTLGQTKIAVLSDTHVMADNQSATNTFRKLLTYSNEAFETLMTKFKSEKPDILLITGDMTEDGMQQSHAYVAGWLADLESAGVKVYVIPGNHDLRNLSENDFAVTYQAFGYGEDAVRDANSLSYACEPVPGLVLIGIDSRNGNNSNELAAGTLDWVCTQAEDARKAGKQVIAMMHHPLFPHISGADLFISTYSVGDYETVRNRLADAGIKVILTGHFHVTDNAMDWNADKTKEIYDLNTGSPINYSCDYRMLTLTLGGDHPNVVAERKHLKNVPSLTEEDGYYKMAKEQLMTSTKEKALSEINNKLSSLLGAFASSFVTDDQKEKLAELAARIFVIHAEGDEPNSPEAAELTDLFDGYKSKYGLVISAFGLDAMFGSVMENKSNYGTDRAFQCADDDLTIELPDLRESVTLAADGWASFSSARDLALPEEGLKGYIVTAVSSTSATLQEVTQIPANTGVLLQGTGETTYRLENAEDVPVIQVANLLQAALEETDAPANAFVLASKSDAIGFYPVQQGVKIPAQKAYLVVSGGSSARMLSIIGNDNTTGITLQSEVTAPAAVYTLQGVRVAHPQKGVYIKNGKLYIAK